jgi:hypothetical protein
VSTVWVLVIVWVRHMSNAADCVGLGIGPPPTVLTRARALLPRARVIRHTQAMAGSPMRRLRKTGAQVANGEVIAFPRMPRIADLPRGWRHWSPAEKVERLLGMSLDRCCEILSWPSRELDPFRLSVQAQVSRVIFMIGIKALLDGKLGREAAREHNRAAVLKELGRKLAATAD